MSTPRYTLIRRRSLLGGAALAVAAGWAAGCAPGVVEKPLATDSAAPRASVTLRVGIVTDSALQRAIGRLAGEWRERTDGLLDLAEVPESADLARAAGEFDLVIFPGRRLGELCEARAVRPVRTGVLESEELRFQDFLPLVRDHEVVYAGEVMALPLGCPVPLLLAPADGAPTGLVPPADDTQLALAYLAWAAPHAVHRSRVATLWDTDTFEPRLAAPPLERALKSFLAALGEGPGGFAWPERDAEIDPSAGLAPRRFPPAAEAYNTLSDAWEPVAEGDGHATLVASSGRLVGVTATTRNAATAFRFAAWLAGPENARELSTASDSVANCRGSLARSGDPWRRSTDRDLAKAFAAEGAAALRTGRYLMTPRLPGADDYLAALGKRVREAIAGTPPAEALAAAAEDWRGITERLGKAGQAAAYARSLNAARFDAQ